MDQKRLADRVRGRQEAEAIIELIQDTAVGLPSPDAILSFCEKLIEAHTPIVKEEPGNIVARGPMTDGEAREFGQCRMMFGKHVGQLLCDVPLKYLDWLAGEQETFAVKVFRYLKNEKVAERLRLELEE